MSEKKYNTEWGTEEELEFLRARRKMKPYLIGYQQAMKYRTDWGCIDKERICCFLETL